MDEPRVDIETAKDTFTTYADWIPGTQATDVYLSGRGAGQSGSLSLSSGGGTDSLAFTDNALSETNALAVHRVAGDAGRQVRVQVPDPADGVHVPGGSPDRGDPVTGGFDADTTAR